MKMSERKKAQWVARVIQQRGYEGIRDQDGWETLILTVRAENPPLLASAILSRLAK
jgi:hypothetical protein